MQLKYNLLQEQDSTVAMEANTDQSGNERLQKEAAEAWFEDGESPATQ